MHFSRFRVGVIATAGDRSASVPPGRRGRSGSVGGRRGRRSHRSASKPSRARTCRLPAPRPGFPRPQPAPVRPGTRSSPPRPVCRQLRQRLRRASPGTACPGCQSRAAQRRLPRGHHPVRARPRRAARRPRRLQLPRTARARRRTVGRPGRAVSATEEERPSVPRPNRPRRERGHRHRKYGRNARERRDPGGCGRPPGQCESGHRSVHRPAARLPRRDRADARHSEGWPFAGWPGAD